MFHLSSTLQFDLMLENELFALTSFLMGINDSILDQIDFRTLCWNTLWYHCTSLLHKYIHIHVYIDVCTYKYSRIQWERKKWKCVIFKCYSSE